MDPSSLHLPPGVSWIDTDEAFAEVLPGFLGAGDLAIDTEADSYYAYKVKICLVQISTREEDYLLDPLSGLDLAPLGQVLAEPGVVKVFHAGANDVGLLRQLYGFEFSSLFDTMLAAQILGLRRPGLASLLKERFEVEQKKTYQTSDWRKRPLSDGQLRYAAIDTRHLLALRDQLAAELEAKGRTAEAEEEFERLCEVHHEARRFDPESFRRARGARDLDAPGQRVLCELFRYRDRIARQRDRSPHRVFPDRALVEIAGRRPRTAAALAELGVLPRWQMGRYGAGLVQVVRAARALGPLPAEAPRKSSGDGSALPLRGAQKVVFEALRAWRRARAEVRGVEESRVATTGTLRAIAREAPESLPELGKVPGMSPFRVREYGEEILSVLDRDSGAST